MSDSDPTTPETCPDCWGHGQFHILANGRYTAEVAKCDLCDGEGVIEKETRS